MDYDSAKTYFSADEKRLEREIIDTRLFQNVLQQARTGHRILMRCDHNGQGRIKVKICPFGVLNRRYTTNYVTFEAIRIALGSLH